jgi:arylsulfatase A-like enzyme
MVSKQYIFKQVLFMKRREFLGAAAASGLALGQSTPPSTERRPPNVLVFFTDQQRPDTLGVYGNPMGLTPNLDRFASEGVRFGYAFTPQPVCAPARSSMQTGKYPTTTGVVRNGLVLKDNETTLPMLFGRSGYDTGYIGKWHLSAGSSDIVPMQWRGGYDQFWVASNALEHSSVAMEGTMWDRDNKPVAFTDEYRVDALTDQTIGFLRQKRTKPFFLFVSHLEPHFQNSTNTFIAPKGYADRYRNNFYIPPDLAPFRGDWKSQLPDYYGIVARIDEQFGRVIEELKAQDMLDNTIVVMTTDHGCHFRTRNAEYKRSCHEASTRVPLLIRGPGFEGGKTVSQLVSTVDLPATLLEATGVEVPAAMQGRSLMNLVRGNTAGWRNEVYIQMREEALGRALRTEQWKYCVFDPTVTDPKQPWSEHYQERHLYDLRNDPNELVNLAGRTDTKEIAAKLREKLIARIVENGEPKPVITPARWYA